MTTKLTAAAPSAFQRRTQQLFEEQAHAIHIRMDRMFAGLMILQWIAGILVAVWISPYTWAGPKSQIHLHLWAAVILGGLITLLPVALAILSPGKKVTRYTISVAQMLFSGLLIHLAGGRIETHFHVFGSLAFLACYREWSVIFPATVVVMADHLVRGLFWPESVYGVLSASTTRTLEHAFWVLFENAVLMYAIYTARDEMHVLAQRQALLEETTAKIEQRVRERTAQLQLTQSQLVHSEKLAAVGQLASGIAHEINTPIQYVGDNISACGEMVQDLKRLIQGYQELIHKLREREWQSPEMEQVAALEAAIDPEYVFEDIPKAIDQTLEGVSRVRRIVVAMKNFAHRGTEYEVTTFDINEILRNTLIVSHHEWKYIARVEEDFQELPPMMGSPSDLSQVFLNLIVNAAHAIADKHSGQGVIRVATKYHHDLITVTVSDTGCGIPEKIRSRIFDPFFTTKEVGRGSGQGLMIAHTIVVDRHQGQIEFESEPGVGTTFRIHLPLRITKSYLPQTASADLISV